MIDLNVSPGLAQKIAGCFTKKFFLSAYEVSDDAYWQRHGTERGWQSLGGVIEYLPEFLAVTQDDDVPVYLMTFRAAPNVDLKRVRIKIKARKSGDTHQQEMSIDRLCRTPVRKALTEIPLRPKPSNGAQGRKLGNVYIKLVEAVDSDGVDLAKGKKIADIFIPTRKDSTHQRYAKRWGQYWNVDEINLQKHNLKSRWYRRLVQSAGQLWRPLRGRRAAYWILTSRLGLSVAFWSQNLFDARGIQASVAHVEDHRRSSQRDRVDAAGASRTAPYSETAVSA